MAQLIKIGQCVSRYQLNLRLYANRYSWLKKRRLAACKEKWENSHDTGGFDSDHDKERRRKRDFETWLFDRQVEWATRTAFERSPLPEIFREERWQRRIINGINDVSFFMYRPVLLAKSGTVQLDSLLIVNDRVCCIYSLTGKSGDVFQPVSQRQWRRIAGGNVELLLNPLISLRRTRAVVSAFLKNNGLDAMDVEMVVYTADGYIEHTEANDYEAEFIDQISEPRWFQQMNRHSLLMKREQLECTEALLSHTETVSEPRTDTKSSIPFE